MAAPTVAANSSDLLLLSKPSNLLRMTAPQKPVKVIVLLHTMGYGGIETLIINWLTHIDPAKVDAKLVLFRNPGGTERPFLEAAERKGLRAEFIPWHRGKPVIRASKALQEIARKHGTQVIHSHNTYADMVAWWTARQMPVKTLGTVYVWDTKDFGIRRRILQQISGWIFKRLDMVTAQCEETIRDSEQWGLNPRNMRVQPTGYKIEPVNLSVDERNRLRAERGASPDDIVVCNVARFYHEKAHDFLIDCWAKIVAQAPNAKLWLYGIGPLEEDTRKRCVAHGILDSVRFMGFTSDLDNELALPDIQIHPARKEGIPLAIISGMAAGLPLVATRVGGIPEVVEDHVSGRLADYGDMQTIVDATVELIRNPDLRQRLGQGAKRFIVEDFSIEAAARVLEQTYLDLVEGNYPGGSHVKKAGLSGR